MVKTISSSLTYSVPPQSKHVHERGRRYSLRLRDLGVSVELVRCGSVGNARSFLEPRQVAPLFEWTGHEGELDAVVLGTYDGNGVVAQIRVANRSRRQRSDAFFGERLYGF